MATVLVAPFGQQPTPSTPSIEVTGETAGLHVFAQFRIDPCDRDAYIGTIRLIFKDHKFEMTAKQTRREWLRRLERIYLETRSKGLVHESSLRHLFNDLELEIITKSDAHERRFLFL